MGQELNVSEELSSVETNTMTSYQFLLLHVSEELSSVETRWTEQQPLGLDKVSEELSSVETGMTSMNLKLRIKKGFRRT